MADINDLAAELILKIAKELDVFTFLAFSNSGGKIWEATINIRAQHFALLREARALTTTPTSKTATTSRSTYSSGP